MTVKHRRWEFKAIKEQYAYISYKAEGWRVKQLPFKANWPLELNYEQKKAGESIVYEARRLFNFSYLVATKGKDFSTLLLQQPDCLDLIGWIEI